MLVTPVSRAAILLEGLLSDATRAILQSIIILALAYALGLSVATGILGISRHPIHYRFFGPPVRNLARARAQDQERRDRVRIGDSLPSHCCS